jgi:transcriptional regulator with XRE-family HTH domain
MRTVHDRLKTWRLRAGLTQAQAASLAKMSQSRWSLIENGLAVPTLHQGLAIQRVTKIRADSWPQRTVRPALVYATGARVQPWSDQEERP